MVLQCWTSRVPCKIHMPTEQNCPKAGATSVQRVFARLSARGRARGASFVTWPVWPRVWGSGRGGDLLRAAQPENKKCGGGVGDGGGKKVHIGLGWAGGRAEGQCGAWEGKRDRRRGWDHCNPLTVHTSPVPPPHTFPHTLSAHRLPPPSRGSYCRGHRNRRQGWDHCTHILPFTPPPIPFPTLPPRSQHLLPASALSGVMLSR